MARANSWPIIAAIGPEAAGPGKSLSGSSTGIGVSDANGVCEANIYSVSRAGFLPPAGATEAAREYRAIQLDALPGEDLALPIERKVVAVSGDQRVGQEVQAWP